MQTPLHIILRTSFWQQPQQQRHMHKVFSANRAVLCLDGTHCSALSLHVCLCGPQSLFRLSCRADTPQTHRPTRIHKHNKQWRLSSSSFIPRPKHTHAHTVTHMHPYTHKQPFSEERKCKKFCECYSSVFWDKCIETIHLFDLLCEKHFIHTVSTNRPVTLVLKSLSYMG